MGGEFQFPVPLASPLSPSRKRVEKACRFFLIERGARKNGKGLTISTLTTCSLLAADAFLSFIIFSFVFFF